MGSLSYQSQQHPLDSQGGNDYLTRLRLAQTGQKDGQPFNNFITNAVYESTKDYLRLLRLLRSLV
jgi:hypothetical protein